MKTMYQIKMSLKRKLYIFNRLTYKRFGKHSVIKKPMMIIGKKYIEIGCNTTIRDGARIEMLPQWNGVKYHPSLIVGDNCTFEQEAHLISSDKITIGRNCLFSARCFITTVNHDYSSVGINLLKQGIDSKEVSIGDNCFFGMDVKIFPEVHIGDNVIVGANSIVMKDIPSYSVCVGTPARIIKTYDFETKAWVKV